MLKIPKYDNVGKVLLRLAVPEYQDLSPTVPKIAANKRSVSEKYVRRLVND